MNTNRKRKLRTGIIAALLMMLILLTGTYAWTQFNNVGFNAVEVGTNFGGRFHDNFVWENGSEGLGEGTHNKDLFAENFGENRVFVRVRLREFMTSGGVPVIEGTTIDNPLGTGVEGVEWPIYVSALDNPHIRQIGSATEAFERSGIEWTLGHPEDVTKVFMPTFNHAEYNVESANIDGSVPPLFARVNAFEMIEATGMAVDGHTFDIASQTEARDILDNGNQTGPGLMGHADSEITASIDEHGEHDYWNEGDTLSSPRLIVDEYGTLRAINDPDTDEPFEHTARYTLSPENPARDDIILARPVTNGVMTMQQWRQLVMPRGDFWVLDVDGWFYWASPLLSQQATSLLLNEITVEDIRDEGIEYVINVEAQFTNLTNIEVAPEFDDMTEDAVALWMNQNIDIPNVAHSNENLEASQFRDPETGTLWRVLVTADDPRGGVGNALIITEYIHNFGVQYNLAEPDGPGSIFTNFQFSNLRNHPTQGILAWFDGSTFVGRSLRSVALGYEFGALDMEGPSVGRPASATEVSGAGIEYDFDPMTPVWHANGDVVMGMARNQAFARPVVNSMGDGEPFVLSVSEVALYFESANATHTTHLESGGIDRRAQSLPGTGNAVNRLWWLRTPGTYVVNQLRVVGTAGDVHGAFAVNDVVGFRAALWVRK